MFYLPIMNELGAEPAARQGTIRDNVQIGHMTPISSLWLNQPLHVCSLIIPPTHVFNAFCCLGYVNTYYPILFICPFIYFLTFPKQHHPNTVNLS